MAHDKGAYSHRWGVPEKRIEAWYKMWEEAGTMVTRGESEWETSHNRTGASR